MTKQLCESESQRLDLEDHVETLVKELDYLNSQNLKREGEEKPCEETVHAKDQYITKLEKEKKELETELNKMVRIMMIELSAGLPHTLKKDKNSIKLAF